MLKKSLLVQITVLIIEIMIGMFLLNQFDDSLKMVHGIVGALVGLTAATTVYFAFREKASGMVTGMSIAAAFFTVLAYVGGKVAATNYDTGLILMRTSAIIALLLAVFCLYGVLKRTKTTSK